MPRNPKESEWYSTPQEKRGRKVVNFTLDEDTIARLEQLASVVDRQNKSLVIEALVSNARKADVKTWASSIVEARDKKK